MEFLSFLPEERFTAVHREATEMDQLRPLITDANLLRCGDILYYITQNQMNYPEMVVSLRPVYAKAVYYRSKNDVISTLKELNFIISRAPLICEELYLAIFMRGTIMVEQGHYAEALENFKFVFKAVIDMERSCEKIEVIGAILQCACVLGDVEELEIGLKNLRIMYDFVLHLKKQQIMDPNQSIKAKQFLELCDKYPFAATLCEFTKCLKKLKETGTTVRKDFRTMVYPYVGYSIYNSIRNASVACTYMKEEDKLKVVANRDIPKNEVIVFEPPYVTEYTVYATHCDVCRRYLKLQSFPCFQCHYMNYCSVKCRDVDHFYHRFECLGYRIGLFTLFNTRLAIRTTLKGLHYMQQNVFSTIGEHDNIFQFYYEVDKKLRTGLGDYCSLYNLNHKLGSLDDDDYQALVRTSLIFAVYLDSCTPVTNDFLADQIKLFKQKKTYISRFLSAIILRHLGQALARSVEVSLGLGVSDISRRTTLSQSEIESDLDAIRSADSTVDAWSRNGSEKVTPCKDNHNIKNENDLNLLEKEETYNSSNGNKKDPTQLDGSERDPLLYEFEDERDVKRLKAINKYIGVIREKKDINTEKDFLYTLAVMITVQERNQRFISVPGHPMHQVARSFYPTIGKFRHSCIPNTLASTTDDGYIILRAAMDIFKGEELTLSYGPHYMVSSVGKRIEYLNTINADCECMDCSASLDICHLLTNMSIKTKMETRDAMEESRPALFNQIPIPVQEINDKSEEDIVDKQEKERKYKKTYRKKKRS